MTIPIHKPVLLQEVIDTLSVPPGGRVLDLTLGLGGHAEALLDACDAESRYLGVDRDPFARAAAQARLGHDGRLSILAGAHEEIWTDPAFVAWRTLHAPDGFDVILMDLGVSTLHLKTPSRGFSFMAEGPLDMRMDPEQGPTALQWLAEQTDESLADAIYRYGEERASRPIARAIRKTLLAGQLNTTLDLAQAIYQVLPREVAKRKKQIDPATRTFQAIRIAVNGELVRLEETLNQAVEALRHGGRLGVISFHSLEDRIVKHTFRRLSGVYMGPGRIAPQILPVKIRVWHGNGLTPSESEVQANPLSRSARLRVAERLVEPEPERMP